MRSIIKDLAERYSREREARGSFPDEVRAFEAGAKAVRSELDDLALPTSMARRISSLMDRSEGEDVIYSGWQVESLVAKIHKDVMPMELEGRTFDGGNCYSLFDWGEANPGTYGSLLLARSLLADATGRMDLAVRLFRKFEREVVRKFPAVGFRVSREEVVAWVKNRPGSDAPVVEEDNNDELPF